MIPFVDSSELRDDGEAIRRRADRDGYLFLRDIVDKQAVLEARRDITAVLHEVGLIDAGSDLRSGNHQPPSPRFGRAGILTGV